MKYILFFVAAGLLFGFSFFSHFSWEDSFFSTFSKRENRENSIVSVQEVRGAENQKKRSIALEKISFPIAWIQPVRKAEVSDLILPNAHASLILDADSKTVLHSYKGKERRQIASLTKMLTAIIVIEEISDLSESATVSEEAVYVEGTKIGCPRSGYCISERLKVGEKISVKSLLKAMLMNSANDAAIVLAEHISGSQKEFAELMNERAKKMGLKDSHFCTPSGLEIEGKESECYSSAYDIAQIAAYSMRYEIIWEILRLPEAEIFSVDGKYKHQIINTDLLLDQWPNCLGGKTGFTPLAGRSLITAVSSPNNKHKLIAVVLDDPYRWQDVKTMANWAFNSYEWK